MSGVKKIKLISKHKIERTFEMEHANRLLNLEKKLGSNNWSINQKGFEFKDNEIIRSTKDSKKPEKK